MRFILPFLLCGFAAANILEGMEHMDVKMLMFKNLKPVMQMMKGGAKLEEKTVGKLCIGQHMGMKMKEAKMACESQKPSEEMMMMSEEDCMAKMMYEMCILQNLGWVDEMGEIDHPTRRLIRDDLSTTKLGVQMWWAENECFNMAREIDAEMANRIIHGDLSDLMMIGDHLKGYFELKVSQMMAKYGMPMEGGMPAMRMEGAEAPMEVPDIASLPPYSQTSINRAARALKPMMYMSCVHHFLEAFCSVKANMLLQHCDFQCAHMEEECMEPTQEEVAQAWTDAGEGDLLPMFPAPLMMETVHGKEVMLGDTVQTREMMAMPSFHFCSCDPEKLYTIIIEDNGINGGAVKYFHYMASNVKHCDFRSNGDVNMQYIPAFSFNYDRDNLIMDEESIATHPFLVMIYEQSEEVTLPWMQAGCNPELLSERFGVTDNQKLATDYGLTPVAATFFRTPYDPNTTHRIICGYSLCAQPGFPGEITEPADYNSDETCTGPFKPHLPAVTPTAA